MTSDKEQSKEQFVFLPHTADVKVRAHGHDLSDALRSAARAYTELQTPVAKITEATSIPISITAKTKEALLYDFLAELVYRTDTSGFVPCDATLSVEHTPHGWLLQGTLSGDSIQKYEHHGQIKAVTYHELLVWEAVDETVLEFVLDI